MRLGAHRTHIYEERSTGRVYVIRGGQVREVPEHVGRRLIEVHPAKLYDADEVNPAPSNEAPNDRMVDVRRQAPRKNRRSRTTRRGGT